MASSGDKLMIITVDGGVATGTTSLAKNLALALEIPRIDSGSMYRAITYAVIHKNVDPKSEQACTKLAETAKLHMPDGEVLEIDSMVVVEWIDGQRIDFLHTAEVDKLVPIVSAYKLVRDSINEQQRDFAATNGSVVDGRDTGTIVFPKADLKLFLTCEDKEAARRRSEADGRQVLVEEVRNRNEADRKHKFGALAKAKDAIEIDSTNLEAGEVVQIASELVSMDPAKRPKYIGRKTQTALIERRYN